ncbi:MAG: flavin reductase family protein [Pseudonocardiaceae bacterium]
MDTSAQSGTPRTAARRLRDCLGHFATGVTVVTVQHGDVVHGATVSAFTSVSLDPPLVMVSLNRRSRMCERLAGAAFGVNILATHQRELALHFAGRHSVPGATVNWEKSDQAPRLAGCVAYLDCSPWASHNGGDHVMYVGEVRHLDFGGGEPLVFHRGAFRELGRTPDETAWIGSFDCPTDGLWALRASEVLLSARPF